MKIIVLFLILSISQPRVIEISNWTEITKLGITHYKLSTNAKLKTSKWVGYPDPNYSWDGDRLKKETAYTDEEGKPQVGISYIKPYEIIANFKPETKISLASPEISRAVREKFGGSLKGFVWIDKISGGGKVTLPFTAPHIFIAKGDRLNPVITEISTDTSADNYYEIFEGRTHVFVKAFSGIGGAAGIPPTLIAHYKFNEDTASDNDELVTNGDFAAWAGDDPTGWIANGEVGTDPEISQVGPGEGYGGVGTGSCNFYSTGAWIALDKTVTGLIVGRKYVISGYISYDAGAGISPRDDDHAQFSESWDGIGAKSLIFEATHTSCDLRIVRLGAMDITLDYLSIKLLAVEDSSGNDHDGLAQQQTSDIHVAGKINGAFDFNGSSDFIEIGDTSSDVKSIAMWVNPDSVSTHTDYPIDLDGTNYITIVNGTVTKNGFGSGTQIIYVNGAVASTITANWHFIVLTSTVGFTADDLDIGRVSGSGYFDGLIDNVMLFSKELDSGEVGYLYNGSSGREDWALGGYRSRYKIGYRQYRDRYKF